MRRAATLAATLMAGGCGAAEREAAKPPSSDVLVSPFVSVVPADASSARAIPVVGASPVEEAAARDALTRLGRARAIGSVGFDDGGPNRGARRRLVVTVRTRPGALARRVRTFETDWLAQLFVLDVVTALDRRGVTIDWAEVRSEDGRGATAEPVAGPTASESELSELIDRMLRRASRAALQLEAVTGYRIASGAVSAVVRLTAAQTLAGTPNRWASTLLARSEERRVSLMVAVLAPDGTPVAYGGNYDRAGGGWAYGASSTEERVSPPPLPDGPTQLDIAIRPALGRPERIDVRLDCDGDGSRGVRDPEAACAALRRDWVALLPPVTGDRMCFGGLFDESSIRGSVGGVRVQREYSNCYSSTTGRWKQLLGVAD